MKKPLFFFLKIFFAINLFAQNSTIKINEMFVMLFCKNETAFIKKKYLKESCRYFIFVIAIIAVSFSFYASNFYPLLCSDDTLNILMAHYYKLPHDIYCWGQDRGGTLIPLISQIFIKGFHFSALTSVSLSNYLILIVGFIGFASLFKTNYSKMIFALIWFLPFERFLDVVKFPIGVQYSLIGFAILFINKINDNQMYSKLTKHLFLIIITLLLIISLWVSDFAIVSICVLFFILIVFNYIKIRSFKIKPFILLYFIFGVLIAANFIFYAKSISQFKRENYLLFNDLKSIKSAFEIVFHSFYDLLLFKNNELIISIYTYFSLFFIIVFTSFLFYKKLFIKLLSDKWFSFFTLDFISVLFVLFLSNWVLGNGMGRWYFVGCYISFSMLILIAIEQLQNSYSFIKYFKYSLVLIVLIGSASTPFNIYMRNGNLTPKTTFIREFEKLGRIGLIGEYGNSYLFSCTNPDLIKATPNDQNGIRNQELVEDVFKRTNIYIIKDCWLDSFPDTFSQFGYGLEKVGNSFRMADCDVCQYKKIKLKKTITLKELKYNDKHIVLNDFGSAKQKNIFASPSCESCIQNYIIFGPYIPIGIGNYSVKFYLKATNIVEKTNIAKLDISANCGRDILASKIITSTDFKNDSSFISINLATTKRYYEVEFRVLYYGNANLYFDHIELIEN